MHNIFISHSRKDTALAETFARELGKFGYDAFIDVRDVSSGQDFRADLKAALQKADAVLVIVSSSHTAANSWMAYEVGMAEALHKPVLTLASDRLSISDLPVDVLSKQIINFDLQAPEHAAREIVERLEAA